MLIVGNHHLLSIYRITNRLKLRDMERERDNGRPTLASLLAELGAFVSKDNLTYYTSKLKAWVTGLVTSKVSEAKTAVGNYTVNGKKISTNPKLVAGDVGAIPASDRNRAGGVAGLDGSGKVPSSQLPGYVDDVVEFDGISAAKTNNITATSISGDVFVYWLPDKKRWGGTNEKQNVIAPSTMEWAGNWAGAEAYGETAEDGFWKPVSGKIYVDKSTNRQYRWSGSDLAEISSSLALGETSSTAYPGDKGKAAYTHAVTNKGKAFGSGLYKITTNGEGHVTAATAVSKTDITALGIPAQDTTYTAATTEKDGLMSKDDKKKLDTAVQSGDVQFMTAAEIDALFP